jgi:DNA-directed RNA polymerase specialized sigma24 family protein
MQRKDAQNIILYYRAIPDMRKLLKQERRELEEEYLGLSGVSMDGAPHSSTPGKPVESMAIALEESGAGARLREIEARLCELEADAAFIQHCLDTVNGRYKSILLMRYVYGYSWGKISVRMGVPDSTARHWDEKALARMAKTLEDSAEPAGILRRASHARV